MKFAIALFFSLWSLNAVSGEIRRPYIDGEIIITYDEKLIFRDVLTSYLIVHPVGYSSHYHIPPSLRLCLIGDPYYECGTKDLNAANFLKNAQVNIDRGKEHIETLSKLTQFPELQNLVEHFKSSLEFGVWKNERLLDYYTTWDIKALDQTYHGLGQSDEVLKVIEKLSVAKDRDIRWKLSFYKWANAMNQMYRDIEGEIPKAGWELFKTKYNISEEVKVEEIN